MFARLDARMEIPSQRRSKLAAHDYLLDIERRRAELLSAVLTIWRFGRQNEGRQSEGLPIGSYSAWARAGRMSWWKGHQNRPVLAQDLDLAVQWLIDPNSAEPRLSSIWRWLTRHEEMRAGERAAVSGRSRSDELSASCNLSFNKGRKSGSISGRASQSVFSRPAPKHTSREWRKTAKRAECGSVECR